MVILIFFPKRYTSTQRRQLNELNIMANLNPSGKSTNDIVDLSVDDDISIVPSSAVAASQPVGPTDATDPDDLLEVWGAATPLLPKQSRRKKRKKIEGADSATAGVAADAIDMTGNDPTPVQTAEEQQIALYKQKLGPLRVEFVCGDDGDAFLKTHSFGNQLGGAHTSRVQMSKIRSLHSELVQYSFNLPALPQGSIFVRANESRLDLVRVLMTGEYFSFDESGVL